MKFNPSFTLREVCGEQVLIAYGVENIDFNSLIDLNSTAADIFQHFQDKEFTLDDIVTYLTSEYDVTADVAAADAQKLIDTFESTKVILR